MAFTTTTGGSYAQSPRYHETAVMRMHATTVFLTSQSASEQYWLFPIPGNCMVVGGAIKAAQPAAGVTGQAILQLGTGELNTAFGTYTVSGGAGITQRLNIYSPVTVSTADTVSPFQATVMINITSGPTTATVSLSVYVLLEYVSLGVIN